MSIKFGWKSLEALSFCSIFVGMVSFPPKVRFVVFWGPGFWDPNISKNEVFGSLRVVRRSLVSIDINPILFINSQAFSRTDACVRLGVGKGRAGVWCKPTNAMVEGVETSAFCWRWLDFFVACWFCSIWGWPIGNGIITNDMRMKSFFFRECRKKNIFFATLITVQSKLVACWNMLCLDQRVVRKEAVLQGKWHLALTMQLICLTC